MVSLVTMQPIFILSSQMCAETTPYDKNMHRYGQVQMDPK